MTAYAGNYVGADGQSYPEIAAHAVQSVHAQHQSPFYGYIRSGIKQKIYLFPQFEDAGAWFSQHMQLEPDHDYAAVFAGADLRAPIAGMEHFKHAAANVGCVPNVGCDPQVGAWWPFFVGLPLGGVGGYFLRRWQEQNPGQALPFVPPGKLPTPKIPPGAMAPASKTSGDPYVGGPWVDLAAPQYGYSDGYSDPLIGGPWVDIVGAQTEDSARRRAWSQTKALIQSAIADVTSNAASYPAEAYVWTLDAPATSPYAGRTPSSVVTLEGTTNIVPFSSQQAALDYLREVAQTRPVALAMFERSSPHWPNPVAWRKSDDPAYESVIAQHVASKSGTQTSGDYYMGAEEDPARAVWNQPRPVLRARGSRVAQYANSRTQSLYLGVELFGPQEAGPGIGHDGYRVFSSLDEAVDWLDNETGVVIYRAIYDATDPTWPAPITERFGDTKMTKMIGAWAPIIGSAVDDVRRRAQSLAEKRAGNVIGIIHTSKDNLWHTLAFRAADDADDWLGTATHDPASFTYAAYYDKEDFQWPHPVNEKIGGGARTPSRAGEPIKRGIATSGDRWA